VSNVQLMLRVGGELADVKTQTEWIEIAKEPDKRVTGRLEGGSSVESDGGTAPPKSSTVRKLLPELWL